MRVIPSFLALAVLSVACFAQQSPESPRKAIPDTRHDVLQIAILLDTSNSMDGLIGQAKGQLWDIVNELIKTQKGNRPLDIQVALYQYGTPSLGKENNYIKQLSPLTDDLDKVSAELFQLKTNGGEEYCGAVIRSAVEDLRWSKEPHAFKAIFIAGNEPFTQGPVDYHRSCKAAKDNGIIVNTIFCGRDDEGIRTNWKDGATLTGGVYTNIDQGQSYARINTPQDKQLAELSAKLNKTYVPYGQNGAPGAKNQFAQDDNAAKADTSVTAAAIERAITKASTVYRNGTWDLVDAVNEKRVDPATIPTNDLPEEMRPLDQKAREDYLAAKRTERQDIQAQIKKLSEDRDKYIASLPPQQGTRGGGGRGGAGGGGGGFGGAVIGGMGR